MFFDKDEYLQAKGIEREELNNNPSMRNKVKGALLVGMMAASIALTGCGKETEVEESTQVSQEQAYESYYFFNGISEEPIEVKVVDKYVDFTAGKYGAEQSYVTVDGYVYRFNEAGCQIGKNIDDNNWISTDEALGTFHGAAMIRADVYNDNEIAQDVLGFGDNSNELECNFEVE